MTQRHVLLLLQKIELHSHNKNLLGWQVSFQIFFSQCIKQNINIAGICDNILITFVLFSASSCSCTVLLYD